MGSGEKQCKIIRSNIYPQTLVPDQGFFVAKRWRKRGPLGEYRYLGSLVKKKAIPSCPINPVSSRKVLSHQFFTLKPFYAF